MDRSTCSEIARLVEEHHAAVYRAAYRLTGSVVDAEDLTQQTFLTAQRRWEQLRDVRAARGWLSAILRTCFLKSLRRRRPIAAGSAGIELEDVAVAPQPEPEYVDPQRLQQALDRLSPEMRLTLTMFYFDRLAYREIAAEMNLPIGTVMSRLARAREQLRRWLTADERSVPDATLRRPSAV